MRNRLGAALCVVILLHAAAGWSKAMTRDEALRLAYPGAEIKPAMVFLTDQQVKEASAAAGNPVQSPLIAQYSAVSSGKVVGRAYLDTHVVRTKKESLLILLNADGSVMRVEVVAFEEPPEYQPVQKWYDQFEEKTLSPDLTLKGEIRPVTGASLTSRATLEAVRRALAIDAILQKQQSEKKK